MAKLSTILPIALLAACHGSNKDTTPKGATDAAAQIDTSLCEADGKKSESYDLNKDGKDDVWLLYKGNYMSCKLLDFDRDGRKDWIAAYNSGGATLYQEADFDYDGKYDMLTVYDPAANRILEIERDTDFDGKFDTKETYDASGTITSVRRDRNGDMKPDQWEQYSGGTLAAVTYDENYDGTVDKTENPTPEPAPTPPAPAPEPESTGSGSAAPSK